MTSRSNKPSFIEEELLRANGYQLVAGVDEAGRGALAGPVAAAAVIIPARIDTPWQDEVRDSKQLSPPRREYLFQHIKETAIAAGIGLVPSETIDAQGIVRATKLAMKMAILLSTISPSPKYPCRKRESPTATGYASPLPAPPSSPR